MTKACPFCASTNLEACDDETHSFFFVVCGHCEATGPTAHTLTEAMRLFDRRLTEADCDGGDNPIGGMGYGHSYARKDREPS